MKSGLEEQSRQEDREQERSSQVGRGQNLKNPQDQTGQHQPDGVRNGPMPDGDGHGRGHDEQQHKDRFCAQVVARRWFLVVRRQATGPSLNDNSSSAGNSTSAEWAQESEHVPPGQAPPHIGASPQVSHVGTAAVLPTAKPERSFVTSDPPHFSHVGGLAVRLFCSTSITCPHFPHLNSKIGIPTFPFAKLIRRKANCALAYYLLLPDRDLGSSGAASKSVRLGYHRPSHRLRPHELGSASSRGPTRSLATARLHKGRTVAKAFGLDAATRRRRRRCSERIRFGDSARTLSSTCPVWRMSLYCAGRCDSAKAVPARGAPVRGVADL